MLECAQQHPNPGFNKSQDLWNEFLGLFQNIKKIKNMPLNSQFYLKFDRLLCLF